MAPPCSLPVVSGLSAADPLSCVGRGEFGPDTGFLVRALGEGRRTIRTPDATGASCGCAPGFGLGSAWTSVSSS
jgi:hypothetical protein